MLTKVSSRWLHAAVGLAAIAAATPAVASALEGGMGTESAGRRARLPAHATATGDFAGRVRLSGRRRLYIQCRATGAPR